MNSSFLTKAGIATLSAGGTGVVGWQIANHLGNPEAKTEAYLSKQKRELASSNEDWTKIKSFYSSASQDELIPNISHTNAKAEDIRDWCEKELNRPLKDQEQKNLILVETWCSKPRTLTEQLSSLGRTALDTETANGSNPHKEKWESYKSSYSQSDNNFKIQKKDSNNWANFENNQVTVEILKEWCKDKKDKQYKHPEDILFQTYQKWCSQ
ncbi:hypothetical protein HF1_08570 [Mycoplasma haemofelis str. Langford 1]|uniref:Uncharacterized protein n=2 Tax=Mycoplasma haemofelis TaxID=29501 RepID=F6FIZ5_MYCHI|nr:hypothetical protein [Mycoplasma haemofelis]AEG73193.1 hypothetical protein MHF_0936 [Mycoplasma haemofelis Ohio2]CBY92865.1 hypothetical protein HF1_08570 [Mycoplasma haemofelis str. Langford 1]